MKHYAVPLNGRIVRTFSLNEDIDLPETETTAIECGAWVSPSSHYERNGEIHPIPAQPGDSWVFSYVKGTWEYSQNVAWELIRRKRDQLIAATDWRATRAVIENRRLHPAWVAYRTELRDITSQPDPFTMSWPAIPAAPTFADEDPNEYPVFIGNAKFEIFTDEERASILSEAQTNTHVMLLVNCMAGAAYISYADPEMALGLNLLVQFGLLTQERKDAIVQVMLPPALRG